MLHSKNSYHLLQTVLWSVLLFIVLIVVLAVLFSVYDTDGSNIHSGELSIFSVVIGSIFCMIAFFLFAVKMSKHIEKIVIPQVEENRLSDLLPFLRILKDNKTIQSKDNVIFQTISLTGLDYSAMTSDELQNVFARRCSFLALLMREGVSYRIFTSRELFSEKECFIFKHKILNAINKLWSKQFNRVYQNKYYIVVHVNGKESNALKKLNSIIERICDHFERYNPVILSNQERKGLSPLLSFWSKLVNRFSFDEVSRSMDLSVMLSQAYIDFDYKSGLLTYEDGRGKIFEKIMMVKFWPESDSPLFIEELLKLDGELLIQHFVEGKEPHKALNHLSIGKGLSMSTRGTGSVAGEFDYVTDEVKNENFTIVFHQMAIFLKADTEDKLDDLCSQARKILMAYGMSPTIEQDAIRFVWLSQFPGFEKFLRRRTFMSSNIANFMHFVKYSTGLLESDWGKGPIRQFKTVSGNSYAFQFHVSESKESTGHCVVFAPTEGGKTTLMQHLMGGAMRHDDLKVFAFDKLNGMSIFTRAIGGQHIHFGSEKQLIDLNPLHAEDTPSYRAFLFRWLCDLTKISPEDEQSRAQVNNLINTLFTLKNYQHRTLSFLYERSVVLNSNFHKKLREWTGDQIGGRWFNGESDVLDFSKSNLTTFDMTDVLEDENVAGPVINYIMYRIRSFCQQSASPHLIFIDETKRYIANDLFKRDLTTLLEEHRKLRGVVCLAFQNTQSIGDSLFQESVLNQCKTRIIFPNPNARREEYKNLELTEGEFAFVKGESEISKRIKRAVLIKRPGETVILDVDLTDLGSYLNLYKSGSEPVKEVNNLSKKWGDQWIEKYLAV